MLGQVPTVTVHTHGDIHNSKHETSVHGMAFIYHQSLHCMYSVGCIEALKSHNPMNSRYLTVGLGWVGKFELLLGMSYSIEC